METLPDSNSSRSLPVIFGVLNITEDSFSDGGLYINKKDSLKHAEEMILGGANVIDAGAQSSNIQADLVGPDVEWHRLNEVIPDLVEKKIRVSVDSFQPSVIRKSLEAGAEFINHIRGFVDDESVYEISKYSNTEKKFILMFSYNRANRAGIDSHLTTDNVISEIVSFFRERKKVLIDAGISQEQLIFDPGMGFFLSPDFRVSFEVLRKIESLREEFSPTMVSVAKKSFLGNALGGLPVAEREIATAVSELFLSLKGIDYIRTHQPKNFLQARRIWDLLRA
ncbi:dihydropteroate synthase [Leptospira gomenensis]|uniref:Dihydropteroate synthase n=1 Tax=Leptospira gomenensis TaxID=2484974 RepID=A0A5F1Y722_9LEPT|nr:dihydropteroate synthase [Leptospira gomenensis]TGK28050.1 dihydropteroate synthase [Leptospira gomenensis]TGK37095.1 dihydropteroate synthase [Leptospira gomenensis]TGK45731.1 dihydropteroate synthase [Leptospira gomenensis]TGK59670.1 dihydropteroate synthase [Leptospira gomenensis]